MLKIRLASVDSIFENWPEHWPKKDHYVSQHDVTEAQYFEFESLGEKTGQPYLFDVSHSLD